MPTNIVVLLGYFFHFPFQTPNTQKELHHKSRQHDNRQWHKITCTHTHHKDEQKHTETHLWRVVGVKASPGAAWTRGRAEGTVHRHLRDELPPQRHGLKLCVRPRAIWSWRDYRRAGRVAGDGAGQRGSPRKAGESPVGCCSLCLMVDWCLVAWCLMLFARLRDGRQIPHGERKLSVLLVLNRQAGQLGQEAAELFYTDDQNSQKYNSLLIKTKKEGIFLSFLLICLEKWWHNKTKYLRIDILEK